MSSKTVLHDSNENKVVDTKRDGQEAKCFVFLPPSTCNRPFFCFLPPDLIPVLLLDAETFHRLVAHDDGEAVQDGHHQAGRQAFGEHTREALLTPEDSERLPDRVQLLDLKFHEELNVMKRVNQVQDSSLTCNLARTMSTGLMRAVVVMPPKTADVHWMPRWENQDGKTPWR